MNSSFVRGTLYSKGEESFRFFPRLVSIEMIYEFDISFFLPFFLSTLAVLYFSRVERGFKRIYRHEDEWKVWRKLEALRIMDKRWINESIVGELLWRGFVLENWSLPSFVFPLKMSWQNREGIFLDLDVCFVIKMKLDFFWIINFHPVESC